MMIERYRFEKRRGSLRPQAYGCLLGMLLLAAIGVVMVVILPPLMPVLILRVIGFTEIGTSDTVFDVPISAPVVRMTEGKVPETVIVNAGEAIQDKVFNTFSEAYAIALGSTSTGRIMRVSFTEAGLVALCRELSAFCDGTRNDIRHARVELHEGGARIEADIFIPDVGFWQRAAMIVLLRQGRQVEIVGVEIEGVVYRVPSGELARLIAEVNDLVNQTLRDLVIQADDIPYTLSEIYIENGLLVLVLR